MSSREEKALTEDFTKQIIGAQYNVINNSNNHIYLVRLVMLDPSEDTCSCPDHTHRKVACKHILYCRTVSEKPKCAYGKDCNRVNKQHFADYSH
jgi:hypothetical protein